jgi:cytochrome d ubiquinol oxidase subunit II
LATIATFVLAGLWLAIGVEGYAFTTAVATDGPSNPLLNPVAREGSWLSAYAVRPWIVVAPLAGIGGALLVFQQFARGNEVWTLLASKLSIFGIISTVGLTMFPFILPSSTAPSSSLTVWDSSSSQLTLFVMLVSAVIFVPLILLYTAWVYKVLWGKVTEAEVSESESAY